MFRSIPHQVTVFNRKFQIIEEINGKFLRACLSEFLALHLFIILNCGCAMVTFNLPNPNVLMVAASAGFGVLVVGQVFGPLSGAHMNNAVSFALFLAGRISLTKVFFYSIAQLSGATCGALFLWAIFGKNWPAARAFGSNTWDETIFSWGQVLFAEILGTMLLLFNVLATIDVPTEGGGPLGHFPVSMCVFVINLFLIPVDGCSLNPARSFGTFIVAVMATIQGPYAHQQPIFWFGPLIGATLGALLYEYGSLKPANFAGAKDLDTSIYMADKRRPKKRRRVFFKFIAKYKF